MIDPIVRPAAPSDVDELTRLEREAREALVDHRGGRRWLEEHPARAPHWPEHLAAHDVVVADLDGLVVGYLVLVHDAASGVARVDEVYVTPGAREVGFGDAMLEEATVLARAAGARVLEGTALPGDRETKNLYERAGITARLIVVSTPLSDPASGADASR